MFGELFQVSKLQTDCQGQSPIFQSFYWLEVVPWDIESKLWPRLPLIQPNLVENVFEEIAQGIKFR